MQSICLIDISKYEISQYRKCNFFCIASAISIAVAGTALSGGGGGGANIHTFVFCVINFF